LVVGLRRRVARHRALVAQAAGNTVERVLRDAPHLDAATPRLLLDRADAGVLRARLKQHFAHVVGVVLDGRCHGVDADDPLVLLARHPAFVLSTSSCRAWPAGRAARAASGRRSGAGPLPPGGSRSSALPRWP